MAMGKRPPQGAIDRRAPVSVPMWQDLMNHVVGEGRPYEQLQAPLRRILEKVLETFSDFTQVVGMSNFMPLLDLFQGQIDLILTSKN